MTHVVQASTTHVVRVKPKRSFKAIPALVPRDPKVGSGGGEKLESWTSTLGILSNPKVFPTRTPITHWGSNLRGAHNLLERSPTIYDKPIIGSVVPADLLSTARRELLVLVLGRRSRTFVLINILIDTIRL
jgi:hypothetical protein